MRARARRRAFCAGSWLRNGLTGRPLGLAGTAGVGPVFAELGAGAAGAGAGGAGAAGAGAAATGGAGGAAGRGAAGGAGRMAGGGIIGARAGPPAAVGNPRGVVGRGRPGTAGGAAVGRPGMAGVMGTGSDAVGPCGRRAISSGSRFTPGRRAVLSIGGSDGRRAVSLNDAAAGGAAGGSGMYGSGSGSGAGATATGGGGSGAAAGRREVTSTSLPAAGRGPVLSRSGTVTGDAALAWRVTGKMAAQTLQRARTPASGTLAGSTR